MFFSIARDPRHNFSHFYNLGPFVVSTDAGWKQHSTDTYSCVYKGYADAGLLDDLLEQIIDARDPVVEGNFCVIVYDNRRNELRVKPDKLRSFPLTYTDKVEISNLTALEKRVCVDDLLVVNDAFSVQVLKYDQIGPIDDSTVSYDELIEFVDQRLTEKTKNFLKYNTLPIKAYLSAGVDTTLVYSYLQRHSNDFELVKCNVVEYDKFLLQNYRGLKKFWAYNQIHHWVDPCVLVSGAPGDEFMLRSPAYGDLFLKYYGIQLSDLLDKKTWAHSYHFNKPKNRSLFETQTIDRSMPTRQMHWELCDKAINDFQHWHLGNTLTWTPLRDLEIYKMFLRLDPISAIPQLLDSKISIDLIEKNCSGLSKIISNQKNSGEYTEQYISFLLEAVR